MSAFVAVYEGMCFALRMLRLRINARADDDAKAGGGGRGQVCRRHERQRRGDGQSVATDATMSRGYNDDLRTGYPGVFLYFCSY